MGEKQSKSAAPPAVAAVQEGSGDVAAGTAAEVPSQMIGVQGDAGETEGDQESAMPSESEILAKLVAHLGQARDRRSPLAEIRAGLPPSLQRAAEDTSAIVLWLSRFKGLIEIVGEPGKEEVVLDLGGGGKAAPAPAPAPAMSN